MHTRYLELAQRAIEFSLPWPVSDERAKELRYSWRFSTAETALPVIGRFEVFDECLPFPEAPEYHIEQMACRVLRDPEGDGWLVGTPYGVPNVWQLRARVSDDFSSGTLYTGVMDSGEHNPYPIEIPIRPMVIFNLLARNGIGVLHSSQVDLGDRSILFSGHSGAGKTTAGRIWREAGYPTLNDEMNLLYMEDGVAMVAATPWNGDYVPVTQSAQPLVGVFFLHQAPENRVVPLQPVRATSRLLANTFSQRAFKSEFESVMGAFGDIAPLVPSYELHNTADARTIAVVKQALEAATQAS